MVAFKYGEWDYICRVSPQPICNLFFRQLLVHPDHGVQAAPDSYLGLPSDDPSARQSLLSELGLGIRSSCSIPRMESTGGQLNSLGNVADIVLCCFSIFVVIGIIFKAFRRKAAVARVEMMILLGLYGLIKFFEIFDTGSFLEQGSQSIVWLTSIHHSLTVLFYFCLIWLGFLGLQLIEDGTKISLIPLLSCMTFLFIGSIYIFLDTGFGVTHYFSSQPASHLYSPWTFSMVILWPFIALTIYAGLTILVSVKILGELKPVVVLLFNMMTIAMGTIFRWILTQPICHSSNATVDGSFMGSLLELVSLGLLVYIWICLTEAEWDEYSDMGGLGYPVGPTSDNKLLHNSSLVSRHPLPPAVSNHDDQLVIVDRISSLDGRPTHLPLDSQHLFMPPQASNIQHHQPPDDQHGPLVNHNYDGLGPTLDSSNFNK